ncbi:MAG: hypothetical protein GX654_07625 [Desulfatiglans sp.]|jgi:hypothetical protein|nr:hypothetical protein [Desulfatiglans sp.]
MSTDKKTKINRLVSQWPKGTLTVTPYLKKQGFSQELLKRYRHSGWIESFGRGAYILNGDEVKWYGALYTLQTQLGLKIYPGGKTALELKGYAHYLPSGIRNIYLYCPRGLLLPSWFKIKWPGVKIITLRTGLFPAENELGLTVHDEKGICIKISAPERAALEMLYLVPGKIGFEEAFLLIQNLTTLRYELVQSLLEKCCSIKVKRLFMFMAEKHEHTWLSKLNTSKIDMGKGKRMIVTQGRYDRKYMITVPENIYTETVE